MDLQRLFTAHPASVGENYWGHLLHASWFAGKLLCAAGACLVHAVFPFLFVKTGSSAITQLYTAMVTQRRSVASSGGMQTRVSEVGSLGRRLSRDPKGGDLAAHGQFRVAK